MFFRRRIPKCNHEWHFVQDDYITIAMGGSVELEDGCWIYCPKCDTEKLAYKDEWERIKRKQEIARKY